MFDLQTALATLHGRTEFAVKRYSNRLVVINYLVALPDSFEGIRENFRGITFDEVTGRIVSLPFGKFNNIGQKENTQFHAIRHLQADVYEKLDGSLIHAYAHPDDDEITFSTRMSSETPQAKMAAALARTDPALMTTIRRTIEDGYTPVFEFVAPNNQIVVEYPKARLVYLHGRNRETGEYRFDEHYPDKARKYTVPFKDILAEVQNKKDFEGFVCKLETGMFVKAKCPWYVERHHAVDYLMKPAYKLYELALDEKLDDVIAIAPDRYKEPLREIARTAAQDFLALRQQTFDIFHATKANVGPTRKEFALHAIVHHPLLFPALMKIYEGKEPTGHFQTRLNDHYRVKYPDKLYATLNAEE